MTRNIPKYSRTELPKRSSNSGMAQEFIGRLLKSPLNYGRRRNLPVSRLLARGRAFGSEYGVPVQNDAHRTRPRPYGYRGHGNAAGRRYAVASVAVNDRDCVVVPVRNVNRPVIRIKRERLG